jgi:hypothetical protein
MYLTKVGGGGRSAAARASSGNPPPPPAPLFPSVPPLLPPRHLFSHTRRVPKYMRAQGFRFQPAQPIPLTAIRRLRA